VSIGGGTFSENPMTMVAGLTTVRYLRNHAYQIYPELKKKGDALRKRIDEEFGERRLETHTTGLGSLFLTHFGPEPRNAERAAGEDRRTKVEYAHYLMQHGIFVLPGHPCGLSTCHTEKDLDHLVRASSDFAMYLNGN